MAFLAALLQSSTPDLPDDELAAGEARRSARAKPKVRPGVPRWLARSSTISFSRQRQEKLRSDAMAAAMHDVLAPTSAACASRVFSPGAASHGSQERSLLIEGAVTHAKSKSRGQGHRDRIRAVLSHVKAQAQGILEFFTGAGVRSIISTSVFDDATMWVQKPGGEIGVHTEQEVA